MPRGAVCERGREASQIKDGWSRDWIIKDFEQRQLSAAVRTKNGNISLDLYVVSTIRHPASLIPAPASVSVSSKLGNISLNVVRSYHLAQNSQCLQATGRDSGGKKLEPRHRDSQG